MKVWKTGERCRLTYGSRTVDAKGVLASPNGRSLFLEFDAILGVHAGSMPVLYEAGAFRSIVTSERGELVTLSQPLDWR